MSEGGHVVHSGAQLTNQTFRVRQKLLSRCCRSPGFETSQKRHKLLSRCSRSPNTVDRHKCPLPLRFAGIQSLLLLSMLWGRAWAARHVRERVQLAQPTGEVNPRVDHVEFDPLIAELEQEQDDKVWLENYRKAKEAWTTNIWGEEAEDFSRDDAYAESVGGETVEQYLRRIGKSEDLEEMGGANPSDFLDEAHFNISDRIIKLFPFIDVSPADGRISVDEMVTWHVKIGQQGSMHRTRRELEAVDADGDGQASLEEALAAMGAGDPGDESVLDQRATYTERFRISDTNKDSVLDLSEFNDFLHPEESSNEGLHLSLLKEELRHRDLDGDGRLNLNEFEMTTHHEVHHLMSEHKDPALAMQEHFEMDHHDNPEKAKADKDAQVQGSFGSFDQNKDGFIDEGEFRPIMRTLWPSQRDFAVIHSKDITKQADGDRDGFLSLHEMLEHPHTFYQTVEDQEQPILHDEF